MQACYRQNKSIVSLKLKVHIQIVHFTLTRWRLRNYLDGLVECISKSYLKLDACFTIGLKENQMCLLKTCWVV